MFGREKKPRRSIFVRLLRTIAIALLFAFLTGFFIGSFLRREIDRPVRYFGLIQTEQPITEAGPCVATQGFRPRFRGIA